jgi:putative ABC transport system permease protein
MGFTRNEVAGILLGEFAVLIVAAVPIGWVIGWLLTLGVTTASVDSELYRFPVVIQPATYAFSAIVVLVAGLSTALIIRRRVDRLDMVEALKSRE